MLKMKTNITRLIGDARDRYILENTVLYHYKSPLVMFQKTYNWIMFFPIHGHLRGHAQVFQGYGETLLLYNVSQTTLGIGFHLQIGKRDSVCPNFIK
jgi:outer membrane phospholipase A